MFEWQNGKYEYTLRGGRLVAMFTVKFTPTAAGMRIQVTQQDGQRYSLIGGYTGNNNVKGQDIEYRERSFVDLQNFAFLKIIQN